MDDELLGLIDELSNRHRDSLLLWSKDIDFASVLEVTDQKMFCACAQWLFPLLCQDLGRGLTVEEIKFLSGMDVRECRKWLTRYPVSGISCSRAPFDSALFRRTDKRVEDGPLLIERKHKGHRRPISKAKGANPVLFHFQGSPHAYGEVGWSCDHSNLEMDALKRLNDLLDGNVPPSFEATMLSWKVYIFFLKADPDLYKNTMLEWWVAFRQMAESLDHIVRGYRLIGDDHSSNAFHRSWKVARLFQGLYRHLYMAGSTPEDLTIPENAVLFGEYSSAKHWIIRTYGKKYGKKLLIMTRNDFEAISIARQALKSIDDARFISHLIRAEHLPLETTMDTHGKGRQSHLRYGGIPKDEAPDIGRSGRS